MFLDSCFSMIAWAETTKTGETMTTLTFDTIAHDGVIDLPIEQYDLNGKAIGAWERAEHACPAPMDSSSFGISCPYIIPK